MHIMPGDSERLQTKINSHTVELREWVQRGLDSISR